VFCHFVDFVVHTSCTHLLLCTSFTHNTDGFYSPVRLFREEGAKSILQHLNYLVKFEVFVPQDDTLH